MRLGFVSAVLSDSSLEEVLAFAAQTGFGSVELMCWPPGAAERRYAGVCHLDATRTDEAYYRQLRDLFHIHGVAVSGLGYYPNPLDADPAHRKTVADHLRKVMHAAKRLDIRIVNTFIGRDPKRSVDAQWPIVEETWPSLFAEAKSLGITLGLENCPMLFSNDEWPGGKNLFTTPAIWKRFFETFPDAPIGLNFDPSHLIGQHIDEVKAVTAFGKRIVHFHAKDTRIDADKLFEVGDTGFRWHAPKLPGLGDVRWGPLFSALSDVGYVGDVSIEVEDRAYEGSIADRKRALVQSKRFLEGFVS